MHFFFQSICNKCLPPKRSKINALLQQKDTVWWRSSQWHLERFLNDVFCRKKSGREVKKKKKEENKKPLYINILKGGVLLFVVYPNFVYLLLPCQ